MPPNLRSVQGHSDFAADMLQPDCKATAQACCSPTAKQQPEPPRHSAQHPTKQLHHCRDRCLPQTPTSARASSTLMAKAANSTTSLTTTTAATREQYVPLPSSSFSTAICRQRAAATLCYTMHGHGRCLLIRQAEGATTGATASPVALGTPTAEAAQHSSYPSPRRLGSGPPRVCWPVCTPL